MGCSPVQKDMNLQHAKQVVDFGETYFASLKGKPISEEIKPTENPHIEGQMDEWHTAAYDGCTVAYYRVVREKRNILNSLVLTSSRVQLPFGIRIGVPKSSVLDALGKPTEESGGELIYECGDPYSQTVSFKFSQGSLVQVAWENEID